MGNDTTYLSKGKSTEMMFQFLISNLGDTMKVPLKGKLTALSAYIKKIIREISD